LPMTPAIASGPVPPAAFPAVTRFKLPNMLNAEFRPGLVRRVPPDAIPVLRVPPTCSAYAVNGPALLAPGLFVATGVRWFDQGSDRVADQGPGLVTPNADNGVVIMVKTNPLSRATSETTWSRSSRRLAADSSFRRLGSIAVMVEVSRG